MSGSCYLSCTTCSNGLSRYDPVQHHALAVQYGDDPGVFCLTYLTFVLLLLGYPDQAQERSTAAVALARQLRHPFSRAIALVSAFVLHQFRGEAAVAAGSH